MTIYDKTQDEKIQFPVGIGIIQTEPVRNFYNTSDATATSSDILVGKTAYSRYGIINGELDLQNEKETSYQEGYEFGYDEGNDAGYILGKEDGKEEIIEGQSDATITPENVLKGYIGYGVNNERIVGASDAITIIDVGALQIKFGYSDFTEIPSALDFSNVTDMYSMFVGCNSLTTVPLINTSNVNNMHGMFSYCYNLKNISLFDTSNVNDMGAMFNSCSSLTTVPEFNTSHCNNFNEMLLGCSSLTTVPELDFSGYEGTNYNGSAIFGAYSWNEAPNITTIGGFKNIGKSYPRYTDDSGKNINLNSCPNLTRESVLNVFNKAYDMNLNTTYVGDVNIQLHANVKALLSDEDIAIATNKGWTVQ